MDEPFNDNVDFKNEEDNCVSLLNSFVSIIKNTLDSKLLNTFSNQI